MGIQVEFNPDLALRNISEYKKGRRKLEECIPEELKLGEVYDFLKHDQRNYWLFGEIPLIETRGNGVLSRPKAGIQILEATHFIEDNKMFTRGRYRVIRIIEDDEIHYECFDPVGSRDGF